MSLTTKVKIGGTEIAQPQGVEYGQRTPVGKTLQGSVIWQGSESVTFTYHHLAEADATTIQAMYDETSQVVNLAYGHPKAGSVTRSAIWEECSIKSQVSGFYTDVTLKFSRLGTAL